MDMKKYLIISAIFIAWWFSPAFAEENPQAALPVVLLELFTSQGCYSCPPAEKLLGEDFARRPHVMALELHVDYWDDLVYGSAGAWKDPFSQNAFTRRQRDYNRKIRNTGSVFTPQVIVHGKYSASGTSQENISSFLKKEQEIPPTARWVFSGDAENGFSARLEGTIRPGVDLVYAVFKLSEETQVPSGENKGKLLISTNVVVNLKGQSLNDGRQLHLPKINPAEEGCAVWVQRQSGGVISAARCPEGVS